jgi:uncharacterized membrane protein YhaH (DUF805 family)
MSEAILTDNENPYSTPDASLDVGHDDEAYQPKIFAFKGRIGRLRYLAYNAGYNLLMLGALFVMGGGAAGLATIPDFGTAYGIAYLVANIAGFVITIMWGKRRLNDLNRTGWLMLLLIVPVVNLLFILYLICFSGNDESNNYGPPPVANTLGVKILGSLLIVLFALGMVGIVAAILIPLITG